MDGILAIDKPYGWTSHDVVAKVRVLAGQRKIGHAGTLDPMATGVLLLCLGDATRVSEALMAGVKWYLARVAFGAATTTDDALGEVTLSRSPEFTQRELIAGLEEQVGAIEQRPPAYAAVKREGVPAYKMARTGQEVVLAPRTVYIHSICLLEFASGGGEAVHEVAERLPVDHFAGQDGPRAAPAMELAYATLLVSCGKGTYIRSIARDLGASLGCGAHLCGLRRLGSGSFTTRDTVTVPDLQNRVAAQGPVGLARALVPADRALEDWPAFVVGAEQAGLVANGASLSVPCSLPGPRARLYDTRGALIGLAALEQPRPDHVTVRPFTVFAGAAR